MEKKAVSEEKLNNQSSGGGGDWKQRKVWDCGSSLYDSFELKSFSRQLDSAITSRTMSMPHLSGRAAATAAPPPPPPRHAAKKPTKKFSKSFIKLVKSLFSSKPHQSNYSSSSNDHFKSDDHVLSSIPEVLELVDYDDGAQPELGSFVGRSRSERFAASSVGISCA